MERMIARSADERSEFRNVLQPALIEDPPRCRDCRDQTDTAKLRESVSRKGMVCTSASDCKRLHDARQAKALAGTRMEAIFLPSRGAR